MSFKYLNLLFLALLISSCGEDPDVSDCDPINSEEFLGDSTYDCPTGPPVNDSISVSRDVYNLGSIEAGVSKTHNIGIKNNSDVKIFDFQMNASENLEVIFFDCPSKLAPQEECFLQVEINEENVQNYEGWVELTERTKTINKKVYVNAQIESSYPVNKEIDFEIIPETYRTSRIKVGPLVDRFSNLVEAPFMIESDRRLSLNNSNYQSQIEVDSENGIFNFYIDTQELESNLLVDKATIDIILDKTFKDTSSITEVFDITFVSNKPLASEENLVVNINEDEQFYNLPPLKRGTDPNGNNLEYFIEDLPSNGVISNCVLDDKIISLVSCQYTPSKGFNGQDTFSYKVYNGEAFSFNKTEVRVNVLDSPSNPVLKGEQTVLAKEEEEKSFLLKQAFDPDKDENLLYQIVSSTSSGNLNCQNRYCTYTSDTDFVGDDTFSFKVIDSTGLESDIITATIKVSNTPDNPVLGGSQDFTVNEDELSTLILSAAQDVDPDDSLTYKLVAGPSNGKLSNCLENTSNLECNYLGNEDNTLSDSFSYIAIDSFGLESEERVININFNGINDAPKFEEEIQHERVNINSSLSFSLDTATDPEGDPIQYFLVDDVDVGDLNNCLDGNQELNCTYNPPNNFSGKATFSYKAVDDSMLESIRNVEITVNLENSQPQLPSEYSLTVLEDEILEFDLLEGSDLESEEYSLEYRLGNNQVSSGELSGCMNLNNSSDKNDKSCIYKPNEDFNGEDSFSYFVIDPHGKNSSELEVTIEVVPVNDPPRFVNESQRVDVDSGEDVLITLEPAVDPEGDTPISYILDENNQPTKGSLSETCFSTIGSINNCQYTANENESGLDTFKYFAIDSLGNRSSYLVEVNIILENSPPYFNEDNLSFNLLEDTNSEITLLEASDDQEDLLAYTLENPPSHGSLSGCLGIDGQLGIDCIYHPFSNYVGNDSFRYFSSDGEKDSDSVLVNLTIEESNNAPYFSNINIYKEFVSQNESRVINLLIAEDLEDDSITYEIVTNPTKGTLSNCFNNTPLSCEYEASSNFGNDIFSYRAFDGSSYSVNEISVEIEILENKEHRVFPLTFNSNDLFLNNDSSSKEVVELGNSIYFNSSTSALSYNENKLFKRNISGDIEEFDDVLIKDKFFTLNNQLITIDESGESFNKIKIYNEQGFEDEVFYQKNINIGKPYNFKGEVFFNSQDSSLYKLNISKIGDSNYSFIQKVLEEEDFDLENQTSEISIISDLDNYLYFTINNEQIARVNLKGELNILLDTNFSDLKDFIFFNKSGKQSLYFKDNNRLYELDLDGFEINSIQAELNNQRFLTKPKVYTPFDEQSQIVYRNTNNNLLYVLNPFNNLIREVEDTAGVNFEISEDEKTIVNIDTDNKIHINDRNLLSSLFTEVGPTVDFVLSLERGFLLKELGNNSLFVINENKELETVILEEDYNFVDEFVIDNKIFTYSKVVKNQKEVYQLNEYKNSLTTEVLANHKNLIEGIGVKDGNYVLTESPNFGTLDNCLGINSSLNDTVCDYNAGDNFIEDFFSFSVGSDDFNVRLENINTKPVYKENDKLELFASLSLDGQVLEYTSIDDELFLMVEHDNNDTLYRYNKAESIQKIGDMKVSNFKIKNKELYFTTEDFKIKKYNPNSKVINDIFDNEEDLVVKDYIFKDQDILILGEDNTGNRFIELSLVSFDKENLLISDQINIGQGYLFLFKDELYLEVVDGLFKYSEMGFERLFSLDPSKVVVRGSSIGVESEILLQIKDISTQEEIVFFGVYSLDEVEFEFFSDPEGNEFIKRDFAIEEVNFGNVFVIYFVNESGSGEFSRIEQVRGFLSGLDREIPEFNGNYLFNEKISKIDGDIYFISRDANWNSVEFYKMGSIKKRYVLNQAESIVELPSFKDKEFDTLSYEIVSPPSRGSLTDCIGMNGSSMDDLVCNYIHEDNTTSSVIDNFTIRAFDGDKYSEEKIVSLTIRNNAPYFESNEDLNVVAIENESNLITLEEALDIENNELFYIITQEPVNGNLSSCIFDVEDINNSSRDCNYSPNLNYLGEDSFKYLAFDGLGFSEEKTVNIDVQVSPEPFFLNYEQKNYMPNTSNSFTVIIQKAIDPNSGSIEYEVVNQPEQGTLSDCFVVESQNLKCTYNLNNTSYIGFDSFEYIAKTENFSSDPRKVDILVTNSAMDGSLGQFVLSESGPSLLKDGQDNLVELENIPGYNWDDSNKVLTLRANRAYNFKSILIESGVSIEFKDFNNQGQEESGHGWTKVYSQGNCLIDGEVYSNNFSTNGLSSQNITELDIDGNSLSYEVPEYYDGVLGGKRGANSDEALRSGNSGISTKTKGSNGESFTGSSQQASGGLKGLDGGGLIFKCIEKIEGAGTISVKGHIGNDGEAGLDGTNDGVSVSYGGAGGAGGGNGGHGGSIILNSIDIQYSGTLDYFRGAPGLGGIGGIADDTYISPNPAQDGIDGLNGLEGNDGTCFYHHIGSSIESCVN